MPREIRIDRSRKAVVEAVNRWAATHGARVAERGWQGDRLRIEAAGPGEPARVDIRIDRIRGRTVLSLEAGDDAPSQRLVRTLGERLQDDKAYDSPPISVCPRCDAPVTVAGARYCGRCGASLVAGNATVGAAER